MIDTISKEDNIKVYEIGYILISSLPKEKVEETTESLKKILVDKGGNVLAMESPELIPLSYSMVKKIGTANHTFNEGYFGWFKFEMNTSEIESIRKAFEVYPEILRALTIITVKENTYLGKKIAKVFSTESVEESVVTETLFPHNEEIKEPVVKASIEEMDKSIDAMVKEA